MEDDVTAIHELIPVIKSALPTFANLHTSAQMSKEHANERRMKTPLARDSVRIGVLVDAVRYKGTRGRSCSGIILLYCVVIVFPLPLFSPFLTCLCSLFFLLFFTSHLPPRPTFPSLLFHHAFSFLLPYSTWLASPTLLSLPTSSPISPPPCPSVDTFRSHSYY